MAWLEKRGNLYRIKFRHAGRNLSHPLKTGKDDEAQGLLYRFEETLRDHVAAAHWMRNHRLYIQMYR